MAEKLGNEEPACLEELAISNSFEIAALVNVLERKGLLTRQEIMEEIRRLSVS